MLKYVKQLVFSWRHMLRVLCCWADSNHFLLDCCWCHSLMLMLLLLPLYLYQYGILCLRLLLWFCHKAMSNVYVYILIMTKIVVVVIWACFINSVYYTRYAPPRCRCHSMFMKHPKRIVKLIHTRTQDTRCENVVEMRFHHLAKCQTVCGCFHNWHITTFGSDS